MTAFLAGHPGMRVEIVAEEAFIDVVAAGFDAGLRYGESLDQDMIAVPLGAVQRFAVVGSPDYLRCHGRPERPEDLVGHRCFAQVFPRGNIPKWEFEKDGETFDLVPRGPVASTEVCIQLAAARAGLGLAATFSEYCAADLAAGTLEAVLEDWCQPFPGPFLYYPGRRLMPAGLRAFVDFVRRRPARGAG